jgi:localization factor PodJL
MGLDLPVSRFSEASMSASNPFNGRRGRRSEAAPGRDPRQAARELAAWLENAAAEESWEEEDEDDVPAPARPSKARTKSIAQMLEKLEHAGYRAADDDDAELSELAAVLEQFQDRISAEEAHERQYEAARKSKAQKAALSGRMSATLKKMEQRLNALDSLDSNDDTSFETPQLPAESPVYPPISPKSPKKTAKPVLSGDNEAQDALRAQLLKLEQRFAGLSRAREEAAMAAARSEHMPAARHRAAETIPEVPHMPEPHLNDTLARLEERLDVLGESLKKAVAQPSAANQPPLRQPLQAPAPANDYRYEQPAATTAWNPAATSYSEFHEPPPVLRQPLPPAPAPLPPFELRSPIVAPSNAASPLNAHLVVDLERKIGTMMRQTEQRLTNIVEQQAASAAASASAAAARAPSIDVRALSSIDKTLAEMDRRLRGVAPNSAVEQIGFELHSLRNRLEAMSAREPDLSGLEDLRAGTQAIRTALGRMPSTEAFARLARDVQIMAAKLEQLGDSPKASHIPVLENAVTSLQHSVQHLGSHVEQELGVLADRVDSHMSDLGCRLAESRNGAIEGAVGSLHSAVERVEERLGAIADNNTTPLRLNAIEHNLAAMFRKLEEQRAEALEILKARDTDISPELDKQFQHLGNRLDAASRTIADSATSVCDKLLKTTTSLLGDTADRLAHTTVGAVQQAAANASSVVERSTTATTAALERMAAATSRQISTLEIAVREVAGRLDRMKADSPSGMVVDSLRSDVQELASFVGRLPSSGATQAGIAHIQHAVDELLGRVEVLSHARSSDHAADLLRSAVTDIASQVAQTVRVQLSDTSFATLQRSIDHLGDRIDLNSDARNSQLIDAVQNSITGLVSRLDKVSRLAPESVALDTIQTAIDGLVVRLERAESSGQLNAADAINRTVNALAERLSQTDSKLNGIASLEKGLNTLLSEMSATRHSTVEASEAAAAKVVRDVLAGKVPMLQKSSGDAPDIARTVADLKADAARSEQRTNDQLNAVRALVEKFVQPAMPFSTGPVSAAAGMEPVQSQAELARAAARRAMAEAREAGHFAPVVNIRTPDKPRSTPAFFSEEPQKVAVAAEPVRDDILDLDNSTRSRFIAAARRSLSTGNSVDNASLAAVEAALGGARSNDNELEQERSIAQDAIERARQFAAQGFATPARRKSMMVGLAASLLLLGSYQVAQHALDNTVLEPTDTASTSEQAVPEFQSDTAALNLDAVRPARAIQAPRVSAPVENAEAGYLSTPATGIVGSQSGGSQLNNTAPAVAQAPQLASQQEAPPQAAITATASDNLVTGSISREPLAIPEPLPPSIGTPRLRTRAFAGDSAAQFEVASRYLEGRSVARNAAAAAAWYERAARQNLAPAQFRLGSLYEKGTGVPKNLALAKTWYEKAAAAGNARAMHNLGVLYAEGGLGAPDFKQAAEWFRKGAERGVKDSQFNYAILLVRGLGTSQDLAESYVWLSLVAEQGDKDAGAKRDQLAAKLEPQALTTARMRAQTWQAVPVATEANEVAVPPGGWDESLASSAKSTPVRR